MAQNDTHVALIILTTHMWGGELLVAKFFSGQNHLAEVVRSKPGRRIYGKTPHTPILGLFGPIRVPYPKGLNCWFNPCKIIILSNKRIPQ